MVITRKSFTAHVQYIVHMLNCLKLCLFDLKQILCSPRYIRVPHEPEGLCSSKWRFNPPSHFEVLKCMKTQYNIDWIRPYLPRYSVYGSQQLIEPITNIDIDINFHDGHL